MSAALAKALIIMDRLFTTKELNLFLERCLISHKDPDMDQSKGIVKNKMITTESLKIQRK